MATKPKTTAAPGTEAKFTATSPTKHYYTPDELKTIMEAINIAPSWMSKRFIMSELLGWSEERVARNVVLKQQEDQQTQIGNKAGGYR